MAHTPSGLSPLVLLVDDEDFMRRELSQYFSEAGFRVVEAADVASAVKICQTHAIDVLVTDFRMPGASGIDLLHTLGEQFGENMPVAICVSGVAELSFDEVCAVGAYAFFRKPCNLEDVVTAARHYLEVKNRQRHAQEALLTFQNNLRDALASVLKLGSPAPKSSMSSRDDIRLLLRTIIHETSQPLAVVSNAARILQQNLEQDTPNLDTCRKYAQFVHSNAQRLSGIAHTVKSLLRGTERITHEALCLAELLDEAIGPYQELDTVAAITFTFHRGSNGRLIGSKTELLAVISNLLNNAVHAIKQSPAKAIEVDLRQELGYLCLTISDSGPGVPEAMRDKIFDQDFTTKGSEGSGLGLFLCRKIVEAHHGSITLMAPDQRQHTKLKGAAFQVRLPML